MSRTQQRKDMILQGSSLKALVTLSIPLMVGNLIQTLYNLTDAYFVGKLGYIQFSAISYIWPITFIFLAFSIGMSSAATSLIAQSIGKNEHKNAVTLATQFFIISLIAGTIFAVIGSAMTPFIIRLMGAEGALFDYSVAYLKIVFYEMPILFLFHVYKAMREGIGDTKTPTFYLGISVVLNMLLDPLFIFTFNMGVEGAAYATVLSKLLVMGFMLYEMFKPNDSLYIALDQLKVSIKSMKNLFEIGIPASVGQTVSALGFAVMSSYVVSYGDPTVAAFGLGNRITSLVMMPAFGLGAALATFVGINIGAGQYERANKSVFTAMSLGFGLLSIGSVILYIFRIPLIRLFISEPHVIDLSDRYMTVLAFVFPLMAIIQALLGAFSGSGHSLYVLFLTLSRLWLLRIPMILWAKNYTNLGSDGVWYAMLVSNVIVCIVGIFIVLQGKWLRPTLKL